MFQKPTITEISDYILYKKPSWPQSFIEYMSEKFYYHYQSNGWRLSSNTLMRDWQAAFNSRWQHLPFTEDKVKLQTCINTESKKPQPSLETEEDDWDKTVRYVDDLLKDFRQGIINRDALASLYKWLRIQGMIKFSPEEVEKLVRDAGNDKSYGRYLSTKLFFTKLNGLTFSEYIKTRV